MNPGRGMLSVYSCIVYEHDLRLVALAALICVLGSWITIRLYARAREDNSLRRAGWLFLAGVAAGGSIWCTHFVAMIGFESYTKETFEPILTGASFFVAIFGSMLGFLIASWVRSQWGLIFGGATLGLAIATMHYLGMMGFEVEGVVTWDVRFVTASIILSVIFSAAALRYVDSAARYNPIYGATGLLTLAIVSLHFTGMTAVDVVPFAGAGGVTSIQGEFALAISVGGVGLLIVGMGVSSYLIDQSVQTETNEKLRQMALHDELTGLANRAQFSEQLAADLAHAEEVGERLAFLAIDLDGFKEINDGYGHAAGDAALVEISNRLTDRLRPGEALGRLGGDEFGLLKPFSMDRDLDEFIDRVSEAFEQKIPIGDVKATLGGSIGVAIFPSDAQDAEHLASYADMAMYHAKSRLRTRVCRFDASLDETASRKRRLTADLRDAIDTGELELFYQIQKDISDGRTLGYEALARWKHPELGMISPGEFIPLAEETGLIVPLGHWVLYRACTDATLWPEDLRVSVNVSALQLAYEDMSIVVEDVLWNTGLPANRLALEITESTVIGNTDEIIGTLREIQAMGITIAMDDFGTGYSSLASLRAFPFDVIKLDRSFVCELEHSQQARDIVEAIITICNSLEVSILAEGVETEAQRDFLLASGCVAVQGFLFGRPAPVEECFPETTAIAS